MSFDDSSTMMDEPVRISRFISHPQDEHPDDTSSPAAMPISPCGSEKSTAADSVTGGFRDIEDQYEVDPRVLGAGHYGSVRECIDRDTRQRYAVKSIRKTDRATKQGSLAREIRLLQEMNHPGIIQLVDFYEDAQYLHIVTDLFEGGELFHRIVEKAANSDNSVPCFAEDEAARIIHQLLAAVSYMHKRGICHRDIKPENILFETADDDSPIKIIDFGLACKHSKGRGERHMRSIVGTPYYMAPEVLRRKYDKSCDVWSVGVIAYMLLCGYPPFNGATDEEVLDSIRRGRCHLSSRDWSGVSREGRDFIRRLLHKDPRKRMTAKQALNHPWMTKHTDHDIVMIDENCQDDLSVEVVYREKPKVGRSMLC